MKVKAGVVLHIESFKHPEMSKIPLVMQEEAPQGYEITLTSGMDGAGIHKDNSKHFKGFAFDFRIKDFPSEKKLETWVTRVQKRLGTDYFVLLEREKNHIHVQWNRGE